MKTSFDCFKTKVLFLVISFFLLAPVITSAHEVYVLDHTEINRALQASQPDFLGTLQAHTGQFIFWAVLLLAGVIAAQYISNASWLVRTCGPFLTKMKQWAPHVAQFTLGAALLAGGYYEAIFGIELPLKLDFSFPPELVSKGLMLVGIMLILGILPRLAAMAALAVYTSLVWHFGTYMMNYGTYLGEALTITFLGGAYAIHSHKAVHHVFSGKLAAHLHEYKYLVIRILFGASLIYASVYAKFLHGALALETVNKYHLTNYFPFDPVFLVLGAMLVEVAVGLCYMLGYHIRIVTVVFLVFLTQSLFFFGEAVWPHIILIGTSISVLLHGYDRYTLSQWIRKRMGKEGEPVL